MAKLQPFASTPLVSPLHHRYLQAPFLLILALFAPFSTSTLSPAIQYNEYCGKLVSESKPTRLLVHSDYSFTISSGYFTGGSSLFRTANDTTAFSPPSFSFRTKSLFRTRTDGVFKLEGDLTLHGAYKNRTLHKWRFNWIPHTVVEEATFKLVGFWSESTGQLCMVGDGDFERGNGSNPRIVGREREGNEHLHVSAVLKFNFPKVSNVYTSWVNGTVESLHPVDTPNHFDSISLLAYFQRRYDFTMISRAESSCSSFKFEEESLEIEPAYVCNHFLSRRFKLKHCNGINCRPLGEGLGFASSFMHFYVPKCSENGRINLQIRYSNISMYPYHIPAIPDKSLVGEGYWDSERSRFCIIACRILTGNLSVGACDIGLTLWLPMVMTLRSRSAVVGRMWSNKEKNDEGYFDMVSLHEVTIDGGYRGLSYNYTELDWVRNSCPASSGGDGGGGGSGAKSGDKRYPAAKSIGGLRFSASVAMGEGRSGWGNVIVSSVEDTFYGHDWHMESSASTAKITQNMEAKANGVMSNVSSAISYVLRRDSRGIYEDDEEEVVAIAAEGMYDDATGKLCMRGCKFLDETAQESDSLDCEILINLQLAPLWMEERVNGTITSTRKSTDRLYFPPVKFISNYMYRSDAAETIRRMDMEIAMALVSLTASCACIAMQIFHAKKNPHVLPFVSVSMLLLLALGHAIPLLLNFEALYENGKQFDLFLRSGRWFAASESMVRALSMIALFLSLRLLQLALASRSAERPNLGWWAQERRALGWCLPLYGAGALLTWLVYRQWQALISYSGLVLDGLLLPQVVFNIGRNSEDKALTPFFYVGLMATRAAPHLYDSYRAWWGGPRVWKTEIFGRPELEFYSTAWDIVVPCVCFLLALLVHLQQRLGGASFLLGRFNKFAAYGAVPAVEEI